MQVMRYEDAVETLFQAPHEQFVAERKRLAGELKAAGDKAGAAQLAKLTRPTISAWVVDQLWWRERGVFDALFESAERVRRGDPGANAAHREVLAQLRAQAAQILALAQHSASETTLRRVTQTLAALAATGSWAPDPPGALSADRDPPGFAAIGIGNVIPFPAQHHSTTATTAAGTAHDDAEPSAGIAPRDADDIRRHNEREAEDRRRRERAAQVARAEEAARLRRAEAERARAQAERNRLEAALRTAQGDVAEREREVVKLERDLAYARTLVEQAKAVVVGLADRLAQLDN